MHTLHELAAIGAKARVQELKAEIEQITRVFKLDGGNGAVKTVRKRTMSAAARKRISEAQKKRWAETKMKTAARSGRLQKNV